jgi:hypothetical protein
MEKMFNTGSQFRTKVIRGDEGFERVEIREMINPIDDVSFDILWDLGNVGWVDIEVSG